MQTDKTLADEDEERNGTATAVHKPPNAVLEMRESWVRGELILSFALIGAALVYAFLAGFRTVADMDTGWQLATGRWVVQHHSLFSIDLFSYTAQGHLWIYPVFSGVVFYLLYLINGYAALSWLNAAACVAATAVSLRRHSPATALLAILAVPSIAFRTVPRADLFTTVLFAVLLRLLWNYREQSRASLWLIPVVMVCWVNLHLGFVSGLALCIAYAAVEATDALFPSRRANSLLRLKRALPYLAVALAATLVNPWGWGIYRALMAQNTDLEAHNQLITEWAGIRFTPAVLAQALEWRNPNAQFLWLALAALGLIVLAVWKRRLGEAVVLCAALYLSLHHLRLQGLAASTIVILGGAVLRSSPAESEGGARRTRWLAVGATAACCLVSLRAYDLITNRSYLSNGEISLFGSGVSWWYPERAAEFVEANHLPRNLMGTYNLGGYLVWRLYPDYPDYVDGRAIPFGPQRIRRANDLLAQPLDSPDWQAEADRWHINTVLFSTSRYAGLGFPMQQDCAGEKWKPVFLDTSAIVFVRNSAENSAIVQQFGIDCAKAALLPPSATQGSSNRARAERYNFDANAGAIFYLLQRDGEALAAYREAESLFDRDPNLYLSIGQLYQAQGNLNDAEWQYRRSVALRPTDLGWYALAGVLAAEDRLPEGAAALEQSAQLALRPANRYRALAELDLKLNRTQQALKAIEQARATASPDEMSADFRAQLAQIEAAAHQASSR